MSKNLCFVPECPSPEGISYHKYPARDIELYSKWLRLTGRFASEINHQAKVCRRHFKPEDFLKNEKRLLHRTAVPSLYLPEPLSDDVDLGLENFRNISISEENSSDMIVDVADTTKNQADEDSANALRRSVPTRKAKDRSLKFKNDLESTMFMAEFDPGKSEREKRKLRKKIAKNAARGKPAIYDAKGILTHFQKDLCDCFDESCSGCHFPCSKCRSTKCGHECRQNRKWQYEVLELDGIENTNSKNPFLVPKT